MDDRRHPGYVKHSVRDVLTQRISRSPLAMRTATTVTHPLFRLGAGRRPFDPEEAPASGATISRFEHAATTRDVYRLSRALVEQFIM